MTTNEIDTQIHSYLKECWLNFCEEQNIKPSKKSTNALMKQFISYVNDNDIVKEIDRNDSLMLMRMNIYDFSNMIHEIAEHRKAYEYEALKSFSVNSVINAYVLMIINSKNAQELFEFVMR